jgi:hypothetical protein
MHKVTSFDEGYARYLSVLAKLDTTEDIKEKNLLFRQLTQQLSDLERRLSIDRFASELDDGGDDPDNNYWI